MNSRSPFGVRGEDVLHAILTTCAKQLAAHDFDRGVGAELGSRALEGRSVGFAEEGRRRVGDDDDRVFPAKNSAREEGELHLAARALMMPGMSLPSKARTPSCPPHAEDDGACATLDARHPRHRNDEQIAPVDCARRTVCACAAVTLPRAAACTPRTSTLSASEGVFLAAPSRASRPRAVDDLIDR